MNLCWWLERAFWEHPDKTAVVDADGGAVSYSELRALANRIGNVLGGEASIGEDDVVVTVIPDNYLHVAAFYAVIGLGSVFSGLNRKQNIEKFALDAKRSRPKAAIVTREYAHIGAILAAEIGLKVFVTNGEHASHANLERLCRDRSDERRIVSRSQNDLAAINFTAGTSGASKGVMFTHGTLGNSALGAIFLAGVTSQARNLSLVGMFHSGGIHDSVRMVMAGGTILWSDGWDVDRVVAIFKQQKPNWMYWIVPTMMRDLMRHPAWPEIEMKGLKTHVAGELVPTDVEAALRDKGAIVGSMYGLTEAMPVCVLSSSIYYRDEGLAPIGSSGRPNKHFCEVKLKDPFTREESWAGMWKARSASGYEAGGHTHARPVHTFVLGPSVTESVRIPVVLAGGIRDGRTLAAALVMGADAVALGTRFVACRDNTDWHPPTRSASSTRAKATTSSFRPPTGPRARFPAAGSTNCSSWSRKGKPARTS